MEQLWPDHLGVWTIKAPKDMPITVITMLQATVADAWESYGGDPVNAEQFWNHLVGNGMADVPRETLPHGTVTVRGYNSRAEEVEVAVNRQMAERLASTARHPFDMYQVGDDSFVRADEIRRVLDPDVPRET